MRVLIVSYYFPPFNTIGAVRLGKTAKYLLKFGHDIRVVTVAKQPFQRTLQLEIPSSLVTYTRCIDLKKPFLALAGGDKKIKQGDLPLDGWQRSWKKSRIWALWKSLVHFPDEQVGWYPFAVKACSRVVGEWNPEILFASAMPFTSLLVAHSLSNKTGVPWVAELRDLWVDNHYYSHPAWRKRIESRVEQKVLSSASAFVTVSEPLATLLREKYGKPSQVVLNGIDTEDYPIKRSVPFRSGAIRIVYTGMIYEGKRDPTTLFKAMNLLGEFKNKVEVSFFGVNLNIVQDMARRCGVTQMVRVNPPVPYKESLKLQSEADVLLLLLWNDPSEKGVFTGKVFEYLGAQRPILAIGPVDNVAAQLILQRKAGTVLSDPSSIADQIKRWIDIKQNEKTLPSPPLEATAALSREAQTGVLSDLLTDVLSC